MAREQAPPQPFLPTDDDAAAGLVGSQYQHLGNLHMLRGIGSIDGHVGNIVGCQGLDALIELGGALGMANFLAQPRPMPLVAPVINTVFFFISTSIQISYYEKVGAKIVFFS